MEEDFEVHFDNSTPSNLTVLDPFVRQTCGFIFGAVTILGFFGNLGTFLYIVLKHLYKNFVSSHFIAHLMFVDMLTCLYALTIFNHNVYTGMDVFSLNEIACRFHTFILCTLWTVSLYMVTCIAGVHLSTFARIHYDQLFGLPPTTICAVSWIIGGALALPCLTNSSIAIYRESFYQCIWSENSQTSYKFLAYMVLLGVLLPSGLTFYAYFRILAIFYHSPVVFKALGLFRSRHLIFVIVLNSFSQIPFYAIVMVPEESITQKVIFPILGFLAYSVTLLSGLLYGASLFLMKEDDINLMHRAHKQQALTPITPPETLLA